MNRRSFLHSVSIAGLSAVWPDLRVPPSSQAGWQVISADRMYWAQLLYRIAYPVLYHLSQGQLKASMPVEVNPIFHNQQDRARYSHLEAVGRTLSGIAPWLAVDGLRGEEAQWRDTLKAYALEGLTHIVDPASPDYLNFNRGGQPLVDGAFLCLGFLRAWHALWEPLDGVTKKRLIEAMIFQRAIRPPQSNWLLFASLNEVFLMQAGEKPDEQRLWEGVHAFEKWYLGDGWYGDGPQLHFDYYNAYVIHPFLFQIYRVLLQAGLVSESQYQQVVKRMQRYAEEQERLISPEGTYPPIGRSIVYRIGALQVLADAALQHLLPESLTPAQVRSALTAVMRRQFEAQGTFDAKGWLQIGFCGHQPEAANSYISTGSLYLCTNGFLPLGLPPDDPFWTEPAADWTAKKAWSGISFQPDHAF
ncbi:DUF2264 domain-containing protein [Thermoflavifilum thermophilum]|uniref:DUF2264 domain-containing protein n=1 Tax=Thermoflavifilum thermophilum TaxID=1393122 RepID=A0A1I7MXQ8_9BACT|nr:DUF2264 domain-containing protein [Thermoflavifilum thermophilum]SFV27203.1 hypothetical protein SAMN05660895_0061 [Thermoflavifilum thermophilum]